jgi:hypothetical protein
MGRRDEWRKVLDSEVKRWSSLPWRRLASELHDGQYYEVQLDSKTYQVEVELLEDTEQFIHVIVSVDDGSLPASIWPLSESFVRQKADKD